MRLSRAIAFAMVAVEAAVLAYMSRSYVIPAAAVAIALAGVVRPLRVPLSLERRVLAGLGLALVFAVKWRILPELPRDSLVLGEGVGMHMAQYLLSAQAILFHLVKPGAPRGEAPPLSFVQPAFGIAVVACAGDVLARDMDPRVYQAGAYAFVVLAALYLALPAAPRRHAPPDKLRLTLLAAILVASGAIASIAGHHLFQYRYEIDQALLEPFAAGFGRQSVGFSGGGRLDSIRHARTTDSSRPALRVYSAPSPGYLRGRVFTTYVDDRWEAEEGARDITPGPQLETVDIGPLEWEARPFTLADARKPLDAFEVWAASAYPVAFLPAGTARLVAPRDRLRLLPSGAVEGDDLARYAAYVPRQATSKVPALSASDRERYLSVPPDLDPRIAELSYWLTGHCRTPRDKIAAVERYFLENYRYEFGIQIPPGREPLEYFLLERPPAHCEYFATGAAVLLRLAGVPARYMTGFVAAERNGPGGYWVARNRDAHAWVEAYDDEAGWVLVEATPGAGVPQPRRDDGASAWMDNLRFILQQARSEGLRALAKWLGRGALALARLLAPPVVLLLALAGAWKIGRKFARRKRLRPSATDPALASMVRLRTRVDKALSKNGLQRGRAETVLQFARRLTQAQGSDPRIQAAAAWYREYARVRYGYPLDEAARQRLAQDVDRLIRRT